MKNEEKKRVAKLVFNKLSNIRVGAVSVVARGANMEPIRIIKNKKDEPVNLKDHVQKYLRKDSRAEEPVVAAVFAEKELLPTVRKVIGEADILKEEKGVISLTETEFDEGDILRMDDNVALAVPGLSKSFEPWSGETDFGANLTTGGFYPSLCSAELAMHNAISNAMDTAEPGVPPIEAVGAILKDFSSYVMTLIQAVPVEAFKFECLTVEDAGTEQVVYKAEDVTTLVESVTEGNAALRELVETLTDIAKTGAAEINAVKSEVETLTDIVKTGAAEINAVKSEVEALGNTSEGTPTGDQVVPKKGVNNGVFDSALNLPGFD